MKALKRILLAVGFVFAFSVSPVFASAEPPDEVAQQEAADGDLTPVGPDTRVETDVLNIPPYAVTLIAGTIIPVLNGLLTKLSDTSGLKAVLSLALSAIAGMLQVGLTDGGGALISWSAAFAAAQIFVIQWAAYGNFWKPLQITSSYVDAAHTEPGKLATVGRS